METHGPHPPDGTRSYGAAVAHELAVVRGAQLLGVYLHGSAVLGGWRSAVSDVDLLVLLNHGVTASTVQALATAAASTIERCPGTGLELSFVTRQSAASPRAPWPFVAHVAGSPTGPPTVVLGDQREGDPDLRLHYAVTRAAGVALLGPPAVEVVGLIPRSTVLAAMAEELSWGLQHASMHYTLLNACRAVAYAVDGRLISKLAGGQWALQRQTGPVERIERALAAQVGTRPAVPLDVADREFISDAVGLLLAPCVDEPAEPMRSR